MKKPHLVKGSTAAKLYMAKIRAKRKVGTVKKKAVKKAATKKATSTHKDTKSHNVNIKVVSGLSKAKKLQKELKSKKLKLTHGYKLEKRKIGGLKVTYHQNAVNAFKLASAEMGKTEKYLTETKNLLATKKYPAISKQQIADRKKDVKKLTAMLKEQKTHLSVLKKLL